MNSPARIVFPLAILLLSCVPPAAVGLAAPPSPNTEACTPVRPPTPNANITVSVARGPSNESIQLRIADRLNESLSLRLPDNTTIVSTHGFEEQSPRYLRTTGSGPHELTYELEENGSRVGAFAEGLPSPFEATDGWALAPLPEYYSDDIQYTSPTPATFGEEVAYLGGHSVTTRTSGCHTIRLVMPDHIDGSVTESAILDSLVKADRRLGGTRYERVTIFTTSTSLAPYGGEAKGADIVIASEATAARNGKRSDIWMHEYIHTRQSFAYGEHMEWWAEASATYLGVRLSYETGYHDARRYNEVLRFYAEDPPENVTLSNESTWNNQTTYYRGTLVLAALDELLRNETNGTVTVLDVFNEVEANRTMTTSLAEFESHLSNETGADYGPWIDRYVAGDDELDIRMKVEESTPTRMVAAFWVLVAALVVYAYQTRDVGQ